MLTSFIERLLRAPTISDIDAVFLRALEGLGYAHGIYAARFMLTVPRSVLREHPVIFSNLPEAMVDGALALRDLDRDPWIEWVLHNDGEIDSRELALRLDRPSPSLALAARHGLGAAQVISLRDSVLHSIGAVVVFPGPGRDAEDLRRQWARTGRDMRVLAWIMHMRIATIQRRQPDVRLTPRQREVLRWRSTGKTVPEVAMILGITPATVEKHMRLAREALGVDTTPQAVLKAHLTHQLFAPTAPELPFDGFG